MALVTQEKLVADMEAIVLCDDDITYIDDPIRMCRKSLKKSMCKFLRL
jgi:hypothetical protein